MRYLLVILFFFSSVLLFAQDNVQVRTGDDAIDFALLTVSGEEIQLSVLNSKNAVVLIVLRGWPEYQCPACSRQVGQYLAEAERFQMQNANVLMVYPGPSEVLLGKAKEFSDDFTFPENFYFVLDPDYSIVHKYGLRWDAPKETAYPSTFIINKMGKIVYSKVSSTHGGRSSVEEVVGALQEF